MYLLTIVAFLYSLSLCLFVYPVCWLISLLLKEPFALKNSETVYFTSSFSTLSYSDSALIDDFDLIFFYFYFLFEIFGNKSVLTP